MAEFKYVMLQVDAHEVPIIFPARFSHDRVAKLVEEMIAEEGSRKPVSVLSAGECASLAVVATTGRSITLGIKSRPEDAVTINMYNYSSGLRDGIAAGMLYRILYAHIDLMLKYVKKLME